MAMISVDLHFECCRRFYYYGLHSKKCLLANGKEIKLKEQQDASSKEEEHRL